jgi:hypothetical protein
MKKRTNNTANGGSSPAPCSRSLVMRHWMEGGTAVTNFRPELAPIYEAAVQEWGDDGLVICSVGIPAHGTTRLLDWLGSLHDLKGSRDLSAFWGIFDSLRKSSENAGHL